MNAALLLVLAACTVGLLALRWIVAPPAPVRIDMGDPGIAASHFFPPEHSGAFPFRWSKTTSGVSLPALSTSQVISITLDPARPAGSPPAYFRLSTGARAIGSFEALPGLNTYTATVGPGVAPDLRLVIDSDTFYPGPGDRRRLGMAVSEIATAPREGRAGLPLPPYPWLMAAVLLPVLGFLLGRLRSKRDGWLLAGLGGLLVVALSLLPVENALPFAVWLTSIVALAVFLLYAYRWPKSNSGIFAWVEAIAGSRWELPAVAGLIALLAVVLTWPLTARLGENMAGWPADNFAFLYKIWWFRTAIFDENTWPLFDPNSYAPFGFDLGQGEPTLVNTIPGAVIAALTNDVAAYNVLMLLSFVISGLGAYLLIRELTASRAAALFAGVAFAFCPYRMAQFAGHLQLMGTGWIAFTFYFLERSLKTRSVRDGALLGLSLALTALSAWYYAYMVGLALALYAAIRLWTLLRANPASDDSTERQTGSTLLRGLVRPAVAALVVLVPFGGIAAVPSLRLWSQGGLTHSAKAADEHSASPLDYIIPNQLHPVWGEPFMRAHAQQNIIESNLYLDAVAVAVIIAGYVARRRAKGPANSASRAWVVLLAVTFVLSLGLTLHGPNGQVQFDFPWGRGPLPLPGQLLFDWLPFYSSMRAYARFGLLVTLSTIVLAGIGWAYLLRYGGLRVRLNARWLTLAAVTLLLVDLWTSPYSWGTTRVEPTEASRAIASAEPGLVMQMPLTASQSGPALWWGTYYDKPIAYGYETFEPPQWRAERPALGTFPDAPALDVLRRWGVRYIVVSANAYGADWPGTLEYLKTVPGLRHIQDFQEHRTWEVDPGVLDAQPELEQYAVPDTLAVFELVQ